MLPTAKSKPWPGASNFVVPFLAEKLMSIHARLVRAIFHVDPVWVVKPRMPQVREQANYIETYVDYLVDRGGVKPTLDMAILYSLIEGTAIVKVDYQRVMKSVKSAADPTGQMTEQFTEFEGPRANLVPLRDFIVLPLGAADLDKAQGCGHRFYLTRSQLQARGDSGVYLNVDEMMKGNAKGEDQKQVENPIFGTIPTPPTDVVEQFELFEMFWRFDIDGSGTEVPCLITFSKASQTILRAVKFPYDHGKPPYVAIRPIPTPNLFYGTAFSQYLDPIQKELTASYQRRGDALARSTLPPILRQRGSAWNPNEQPIAPGETIDVNDPNEVTVLQLPDYRPSNIQHEQMLIALGERITGISDFQLGRSPGSGRTFGEVRSVLSEGEVRIDVLLARIHEGMRRIAELIFDIAYQFMPMQGVVPMGQDFFQVTREMMRPPGVGYEAYEFVPNGTLSEASKEQKLERTLVLVNQFMQNPLLMNPQLNPQAPLIAAQLMQKVLIEAGWMDWDKYLPMLQPEFQQQQAVMQQQQAAQAQQAQMLQEQAMQAEIAGKQAGAMKTTAEAAATAAPMIQQMMGGQGVQ